MKHRCHVILVSGQPTPNLTPMLDRETQPEEIIMVVSPDMRQHADWLDEVFRPRGLRTTRWDIEDAWDLEQMQEQFLNKLAELPDEDLALNVTGGTKPMAIAAYQAFLVAQKPIYYVHPQQDRLIWLQPTGQASRDLEDRLKLQPFFMAHGVTLETKNPAFGVRDNLFEVANELVDRVDQYQEALKRLNGLASGANNPRLQTEVVPAELQRRDDFESLVWCFESRNLLEWQNDRIQFPSEGGRFFVNGGWLEHYVHAIVQRLARTQTRIQDVGRGLEVTRVRGKSDARNEIDVAFLADNRLHVIECKTASYDENDKGDQTLYKIQTLTGQLGGLQAKAMLVSYQKLPPAVVERARTDNIQIVAAAQIKTLDDKLRKWINPK